MIHDQGCILKTYPLGSDGLIVIWLTPQMGVLRSSARLARKPGGPFYGLIDLFFESKFIVTAPKSGDLYTLKSVELLRPRLALRSNLLKLRLASYMNQLILMTVDSVQGELSWHTLLSGALDYLETHDPSLAVLTHFERRLASLHGVYVAGNLPHVQLLRHFGALPDQREQLLDDLS